jgi:Fe-S-cluster containining protein
MRSSVFRLPLSEHPEQVCSSCHAMCCEMYVVHIGGHDLWRLVRGLGLPWDAIAEIAPQYPAPASMSFRLSSAPARVAFSLRRRPSGTCQFLLELGAGYRRCGAHAFRPWACRSYPLAADMVSAPAGADLIDHACCPVEGLEAYQAAVADMLPGLEADRGEEWLYIRVLERWETLAATVPAARPIPAAVFADWVCALYDALEPMRRGERGDWQLAMYTYIANWPLPSV